MAAANTQDGVSDDLNYETWALTAKTTLVEKGLWDVVENGVSPDPTKIPEIAATIKVGDLAHWRNRVMRDIKALKILQASLPDSSFRKTISAASAKELWDSLEEAKLRSLENQFEELCMCERESIKSYFARVNRIVEQLRVLKNEKSDYEVVKKVLGSLSASYKEAAPVIEELMDLKKMTLETLAEFFRRFDAMPDEYVHQEIKRNRLKAKLGIGKWCDVCYKEDHNLEECHSIPKEGDWSLKPGIYGRHCFKRVGTEARNQTEQEELAVDYILLAKLELSAFTYDEDTWMLYGHATSHMTPYEKLFTNLDRTQKAKVGLVDGTVIMAEGRGDVKVVMKDGKKRTIKEVLFVPRGINRNVLSVPLMTSSGCSLKPGERGECIVRDRSGAVFGDTTWDERGLSIRMQVVEANLSS